MANTGTYRVECRECDFGYWTVDDDTITGTSHTVDGLLCGKQYQFQVSAYSSGTTYTTAWNDQSEEPPRLHARGLRALVVLPPPMMLYQNGLVVDRGRLTT